MEYKWYTTPEVNDFFFFTNGVMNTRTLDTFVINISGVRVYPGWTLVVVAKGSRPDDIPAILV